jgi:hypothetical protein
VGSQGRPKPKKIITKQERENMKTRTLKQKCSSALMLIAALTVAFSSVSAQEPESNGATAHGRRTIQGVWQVTRMGVNCDDPNQTRPPFPALMTFYRDGTLTAYANPPGTGPLDTPEAGLWQREPGSQNYSFHDISYVYDENGAFAGSGVVTANVHLTSANSFEYSATIQFFDADGNLVFSGCGRATGTRFE